MQHSSVALIISQLINMNNLFLLSVLFLVSVECQSQINFARFYSVDCNEEYLEVQW
jgi:hypothetical protein